MALTPDPSESFAREVDENLRRDQARDFARKNGKWLVLALVLLLAAIGGWMYWQDRQKQQAGDQVEEIAAILQDVGAGSMAAAPARLDALTDADADGVRATASLARAALALQQNDRALAIRTYTAIAADKSLAPPYRDVATLRLTAVEYDSLKPDQVISRLQPLVQPGKPFFGSAGELTAMAMLAKGQKQPAGELFAKIAADSTVPDSIRSRAVQIAGSLGVDASASLPTGLLPAAAQ